MDDKRKTPVNPESQHDLGILVGVGYECNDGYEEKPNDEDTDCYD